MLSYPILAMRTPARLVRSIIEKFVSEADRADIQVVGRELSSAGSSGPGAKHMLFQIANFVANESSQLRFLFARVLRV